MLNFNPYKGVRQVGSALRGSWRLSQPSHKWELRSWLKIQPKRLHGHAKQKRIPDPDWDKLRGDQLGLLVLTPYRGEPPEDIKSIRGPYSGNKYDMPSLVTGLQRSLGSSNRQLRGGSPYLELLVLI